MAKRHRIHDSRRKCDGGANKETASSPKGSVLRHDATVEEILKRKKGSIKAQPLDPGSLPWTEIGSMKWQEVEQRARRGEPGFKMQGKLLSSKEYDKGYK